MQLSVTTPAVLFPAISLLLLAYTNRFLALSSVVRAFDPNKIDQDILRQIDNLKHRIRLIRYMQEVGGASFLFCVISMLFLHMNYPLIGSWMFAISLFLLLISLWLSVREIHISLRALNVHLQQFDNKR